MAQTTNTQVAIDQVLSDPKKDKYVSFRLLLSEVSELKSMAQAENKNVSRFIRYRIFSQRDAAA